MGFFGSVVVVVTTGGAVVVVVDVGSPWATPANRTIPVASPPTKKLPDLRKHLNFIYFLLPSLPPGTPISNRGATGYGV